MEDFIVTVTSITLQGVIIVILAFLWYLIKRAFGKYKNKK